MNMSYWPLPMSAVSWLSDMAVGVTLMPIAFSHPLMYGASWVSVGDWFRTNRRSESCLPFLTLMPFGPIFQPSAFSICSALAGSK